VSGPQRNRAEYENRVNRVMDYVGEHLAEDLSLDTLAQVAAFSPFHFHRVFKSVTGENLNEFVQRLRLEWAATALTARPQAEVLEIALECGFQSQSAFARAFKDRFGSSATEWRGGAAIAWGKIRMADRKREQTEGKPGEEAACASEHGASSEEEETMKVTVKTLPDHHLAYMRNVGPYGAGGGIPQLWQRLQRWAAARDLWTRDRVCLGISHDNPAVTDPGKCRYDAGIVIPPDFKTDAQVNVTDMPAGKYATMLFEGRAPEITAAWDNLFGRWLPGSGYQPAGQPCFELYRGEAVDEETGFFRCELCLGVKPL
jgi:AraC family transcriptional regulator